MSVDVLLGLQWGDEGKGKIVDALAPNYDVIARFQGGPNAGHTLIVNDRKLVLHTVPSGIYRDCINLIGNGVVLDPITLVQELKNLDEEGITYKDKLYIAKKAHLILPTHKLLDAASEHAKGQDKIGSTLRGIGPAYMDKTGRNGMRVGDLLSDNWQEKFRALKEKHRWLLQQYQGFEYNADEYEAEWKECAEQISGLQIVDSSYFINKLIRSGKKILAEGAQGSMLDIDHGTYPYVTSSNTITAGVLTGLGIAPNHINEVIGITKAYCTRVGSGPFPTELHDDTGEQLRKAGNEFGATTGRPRRCGWIDLPALEYTLMINGVTQLAISKIDVLNEFESIKAAVSYKVDGKITEELPYDLCEADIEPVYRSFEGWQTNLDGCTDRDSLPENLQRYLDFLEAEVQVRVTMLSTGPGRDALLNLREATLWA